MRKRQAFFAFVMLTTPSSGVLSQQQSDPEGEKLIQTKSDMDPCPQYKSASFVNEYVNCLTDEAERGSTSAANLLIDIYNGSSAVPPDQKKATYYASMSARQNDPIGMRSLAARNAIGLGTEKNWDEALRLRRRQAQLYGFLPPLHISGYFTGSGFKDSGVVTVTVPIRSDGSKKSCSATGGTEKLQKFACNVVMKYFAFLPAVSPEGQELESVFSTTVTFKPYRKPDKIDASIPAKLVSGEITRQDFAPYNINIQSSDLVLNLEINSMGAIIACKSASADAELTRTACQIAKRKLVFTPSKNVRGQSVASQYDLIVSRGSIALDDRGSEQSGNPSSIIQQLYDADEPEDKILQTAIQRCTQIGFEKGTGDYKACVMDQIKLLSGAK